MAFCVVTFMPCVDRRRARGRIAAAAFDLDEAQAARAERLQLSVAQSFGICVPTSAAARMTDVPAGTVTAAPSISSVTSCRLPDCRAGRAERHVVDANACALPSANASFSKSSGKCFRALSTGYGRQAAQRAQRAVHHRLAQLVEQLEVRRRGRRAAMIRSMTSTPRVEPMRHGVHLPHDSIGAELHRIPRLRRHVHGVVEDDDAAVTEQRADARQTPRSRAACRTATRGCRRRAARRPARRGSAGPTAMPPPKS